MLSSNPTIFSLTLAMLGSVPVNASYRKCHGRLPLRTVMVNVGQVILVSVTCPISIDLVLVKVLL